jgi:hypothetical protein
LFETTKHPTKQKPEKQKKQKQTSLPLLALLLQTALTPGIFGFLVFPGFPRSPTRTKI